MIPPLNLIDIHGRRFKENAPPGLHSKRQDTLALIDPIILDLLNSAMQVASRTADVTKTPKDVPKVIHSKRNNRTPSTG